MTERPAIPSEGIAAEGIAAEVIAAEVIATEGIATEVIATEEIATEEIATEEIAAEVIAAEGALRVPIVQPMIHKEGPRLTAGRPASGTCHGAVHGVGGYLHAGPHGHPGSAPGTGSPFPRWTSRHRRAVPAPDPD
jgi:hypothetical protein